jgi:serine/threonine-protein kinase HipA
MLNLARACGLSTAESRLKSIAGRDVLLVKRFDPEKTQAGYLRSRMISALTLLRSDEAHESRGKWSYVVLAAELFRRMCFNALISNIDDHPRNLR